jgi:hypothetical protein
MDLDQFVDLAHAHCAETGASNLEALGPALRALGRTAFVADYLRAHMDRPDFQVDNHYEGDAVVLARRSGPWGRLEVRALPWDSRTVGRRVWRWALGQQMQFDAYYHTHTFALLTYGYFGPGYSTDIIDVDPEALAAAPIGTAVEMRAQRRYTLQPGEVFLYPMHTIAHRQLPPPAYSISLNLMVFQAVRCYPQFRIQDGRLVAKLESV